MTSTASQQVTTVPSSVPYHPLIKVVAIPQKGLGAVARRDIKKGELVLEETPLFQFDAPLAAFLFSRSSTDVVISSPSSSNPNSRAQSPRPGSPVPNQPQSSSSSSATSSAQAFDPLDIHLGKAIDNLMEHKSDSDKQVLLDLANSHPELPEAYAIFKSNAVQTASSGGLFPLLSRLNSSCRPSCSRPLWFPPQTALSGERTGRVIKVWALRDVKEGEELDWEYLDGSLRTGEERREETERILGFACRCPACILHPNPPSDTRVLTLRHLSSLLPDWDEFDAGRLQHSPSTLISEIATLEEMLPIAREEGILGLVATLEKRLEVCRGWKRGPRGMDPERAGIDSCFCCV